MWTPDESAMEEYLAKSVGFMGNSKSWQTATTEEMNNAYEILANTTLSVAERYKALKGLRDEVTARYKASKEGAHTQDQFLSLVKTRD